MRYLLPLVLLVGCSSKPVAIDGVTLCELSRNDFPTAKTYVGKRMSFAGQLTNIEFDITNNSYKAKVVMPSSFVNSVEKFNVVTVIFPPKDKRNFEAAKTSPTRIEGTGTIERMSEDEKHIYIVVSADPS